MTTTDPYRLTTDTDSPQPRALTGADLARTTLWGVLVISVVGNMAASYSGAATHIHLACGAVTALCVTALVIQRLRGRR
ncbi:hypothetical protein [Streptomyces sp. PSKA30]|uniref:hypothetical protein n=1 Tax=Streptomyces sp. PSKA30 TaxID=2874597 RepID=UPI001CD06FD4|nr:hypothetical protein [Streptomyces sp. PSKA30]MBZ9642562.1 hypothetical protein [Streptomyces sp. PSKA30]